MTRQRNDLWPEEDVEMLRDGWAKGLSAGQISRKFNGKYSRNAVIGKVHRLGLSGRGPSSTPRPPRNTRPRKYLSPSQRRLFSPRLSPRPDYTPQPRLAAELAEIKALPPIDPSLTVLRLTTYTCRFPIGEPDQAGFTFCGRTCDAEEPYCCDHTKLAYTPGRPRQRKPGEADRREWRERFATAEEAVA